MPVNRTLEAMRTHSLASRNASDRDLAQLAGDDVRQSPPIVDVNGVTAYSGERAIAHAFRTAEAQKLYFRTETVSAGIATLVFATIAIAIVLYPYFHG